MLYILLGIQDWASSFLDILGKLIYSYRTIGFPFALAHLLVLFGLVYQTWYRKILVETKALEQWQPRISPPPDKPTQISDAKAQSSDASADSKPKKKQAGEPETVVILDQFVGEVVALGDQGFFVPMSDFTDRLDSITDSMLAEFHDRTNLFILVGVAGTMLGIFEFAFNSNEVLKSNLETSARLVKLGEYLSGSMAKAFPVGFVGLTLTFLTQVAASTPERRLRTALADATRRALQVRQLRSRSQAGIVQQSVSEIKAAMLPLENLQQSLDEVLAPIVANLGARLEQSLDLIKAQSDELQKTNVGTHEIVGAVNVAVGKLEMVVNGLQEQIQQTKPVIGKIVELQNEQITSLHGFNSIIQRNLEHVQIVNNSLAEAVRGVDDLSLRMFHATEAKLNVIAHDTLVAWGTMSQELKDLIVQNHSHLLVGVAAQAQNVERSLTTASGQLGSMAASVHKTLDSFSTLPLTIQSEIQETFSTLSQGSLKTWELMSNEFVTGFQQKYTEYLGGIRSESEETAKALNKAAVAVADISKSMDEILKEAIKTTLQETKNVLSASIRDLNHLFAEHYPEISQNVATLSNSLKTTIEQTQTIQRESNIWLDRVITAHETISKMQQMLTAAAVVAPAGDDSSKSSLDQISLLLSENVNELKRLNAATGEIQKLIPTPDKALQEELQKTTRILTDIHTDIHNDFVETSKLSTDGKQSWVRRIISRRPD